MKIEERGISVVADIDDDQATSSSSPVERFGTIILITGTRQGATHDVRVRTEDSPDVAGEFCASIEVSPTITYAPAAAESSFARAGRATHHNDWQTAFDEYSRAASAFDSLHLLRMAAATRHAMAELAYRRLDRKRDSFALVSEAIDDYTSAFGSSPAPIAAIRQRSTDRILIGLLTALEGKALLDAPGRDVSSVIPLVRKLFSVARTYDRASGMGARELPRLDIMSGFLEYRSDSPGRALDLFAQAARTCYGLHDWDCYAIANQNLALLAAESNNYATALSEYGEALRMLPPDLNPKLAADIWNNLGHLQGVVGLFSSSEHSHATAMHEYARLGDCPGVRRSLSYSGNLLLQIGTLRDAEDYLERAASSGCSELLAQSNPSREMRAPLQAPDLPRAAAVADGNRHPCVHPLESSALATDNKMIVFNSLLSLGDAFLLEGEPGVAQRCIDAAAGYAVTARTRMRLAIAHGTLLLESNDARGAQSAFEQSLRIADEGRIPLQYEYRGTAQLGRVRALLLAGQTQQAVQESLAALRASASRADIDQTIASLQLLAAGLRNSDRPREAAHTLEVAADLIDAVPIGELDGEKRATYLATQYSVFADLTDLYATQAANDSRMAALAFETSEHGRARSLRYALSQAARDAPASVEAPTTSRYQQLLREVVNLTESRSDDPPGLIDELDTAARHDRTTEQPLDRVQLAHTLEQLDATLVEYVVGQSDMFAFVLNEDTTRVVRLGSKREIAAASADLHDRLRDPETPGAEVRAAAQRLSRLVVWPISGAVLRKRIIIVPDDALHTVPFNVLSWSANPSDQLVVNRAEVSLAPSALFLTRVHTVSRAHAAAPRLELIGDPVFRISDWRRECADDSGAEARSMPTGRSFSDWTESLPRLPGSRVEVETIGQLARQSRPASHVEIFVGCAAGPSALRRAAANHVDLLHVATHARVDAQRPRLSALALAPEAEARSGAATFGLLDILELRLNSSLVVLSACDTSRGRLLPGEGVLGPAQAFLQSGAASVLASYWRVDDAVTADFMERFYRHLLLERLPAATALRRAQLDQIAKSGSYDWAAFALYGWPDTLL